MHRAWRFLFCSVLAILCSGRAMAWDNVTLSDLEEEVRSNELVLRGVVLNVESERFTCHAFTQEVVFQIKKRYKGSHPDPQIRLFLNLPVDLASDEAHHVELTARNESEGRPREAANAGDELIVPIKKMEIVSIPKKDLRPDEPDSYYTAPSFYPVRKGRIAGSPFSLSKELNKRSRLEDFDSMLAGIVAAQRSAKHDEYRLGKVLFFDDFNDNSYAGWTFLVGHRGEPAEADNFYGEKWVGPGLQWTDKYPEDKRGTRGRLVRIDETGNYEGVLDTAKIQIGAYDGRLRLRCSRLWHHVTVVTGDPNWKDYQIECDVYNLNDKQVGAPKFPELIAQENYLEFGLYGRVRVPNLSETNGEHSLIAVEFGPYSNEMTMVPMWTRVPRQMWHHHYQIRAKLPDASGGREKSFWNKQTRILACKSYEVPQNKRMRLKARFMGNHVEGYIDDVKIVDGVMSPLPEIMRTGRIALWVFETWAEFDNIKVTELVRVDRTARQ